MRSGTLILLIFLAVFAVFGLIILGVVGLALFLATAHPGAPASRPAPEVVTATDGRSRLTLPAGWSVLTDLNERGKIQAGNKRQETYLVVLTEPKENFADDMDYHEYSRITRTKFLGNLGQPQVVAGPTELVLNGRRAVQYEIHGVIKSNRVKCAYLHTAVDGEKCFHQVLAWTLPSRLAEQRPVLDGAISSFTDVP
jgi:hypothetical protein